MKLFLYGIVTALLISVSPVAAIANALQQSLIDIANVEQQGKAREEAKVAAEEAKRKQAAAATAAKKAKQDAARAAAWKKKENERLADKKREHVYEDQVRDLELENKRLDLQMKKQRVARTDEFIDAELKQEAAKTDAIQSEADARRNISSGTKSLMESEGKAKEEEAKSFF